MPIRVRQLRILGPVHPRLQGVPVPWRYPTTISGAIRLEGDGTRGHRPHLYAGTGLTGMIVCPPPFEAPTYVKDTPSDPEPPVVATAPDDDTVPLVVSFASVPGVKKCAIAPSGTEACWELADSAMPDIPNDFLNPLNSLSVSQHGHPQGGPARAGHPQQYGS